ncbi:hypothetical protein Tco_0545709 [Tanacetum coccineum]
MSSYNHFGCSWCGGPFNGGNCPGCSSVGSRNEFVYDPNPYSYNETPNFFNQPPQHQYETYSCELCGDSPHYGFDCQTQPPLVYEQDPCNNQNFGFDQPPYYSPSQPQQFDCCEVCGGPHYSSDCQTRNPLVYEPNPCNNYDFPYFDQPSQFTPPQPLPLSELNRRELITQIIESQKQFDKIQEQFNINQEKLNMNVQNELNRHQEMLNLRNSNQDPPVDLYYLEGSDEGDLEIGSLTKEPSDTLLMGDEVISTTLERENDEFIKSSVDDLVPIPRESEVTSVCDDLECDMPVNTPLPTTDVREEDFDINSPLGEQVVDFLMENVDVAGLPRKLSSLLVTLPLPCTDVLGDAIVDIDLLLGEHLDTLSTGDREIDFNPSKDIEELERLLADDPIPVPRVFDEPLGNSDSMSRSSETSDIFKELIVVFGLDDSILTEIDDRYHDSEGDILYFEQLLNEDTSSDVSPSLLPTESFSLDLPLPDPKKICLREVERFDPFFSLT